MKRLIRLNLLLLLGCLFINVNADCTQEMKDELFEKAKDIKVNYEAKNTTIDRESPEGGIIKDEVELLYINFYNIDSDLFLMVTSSDEVYTDENPLVIDSSSVKNGKFQFVDNDINLLTKYKIKVYSTNDCGTILLRSFTFDKPKLNPNYKYITCQEHSDVPICQKYINKNIDDYGVEIERYVNEYLKDDAVTTTENDNSSSIFTSPKTYVIAFLLIVALVSTYVVWNRKKGEIK